MATLFFFRLVGLTAGTLVYLFLIALILGHRRPRFFERLLFFLVLSLFLIYAGALLEMNASMTYGMNVEASRVIYDSLTLLGTFFLLPLIWHTHLEYVRTIVRGRVHPVWWGIACVFYAGIIYELASVFFLSRNSGMSFLSGIHTFRGSSSVFMWTMCAISAGVLQLGIARKDPGQSTRRLAYRLFSVSLVLATLLAMHLFYGDSSPVASGVLNTAVVVAAMVPGALLIYWALRRNFLEYGAQRNLVYALSAMFLLVLYLALVRRASGWLEPMLPPEATAAILLFVLIFLFEPLERVIGPALHRAFRERISQWRILAAELHDEARQGNVARFTVFVERRIREEYGLAAVRLCISRNPSEKPLEAAGGLGHALQVPLLKDGEVIGVLEAASTGSFLTGETSAAMEFLAEQLPAMLDLCRLIEEKVRLERELADRERLALLGQMAASVSHNLRNPLSSMKTILQVQLEHPYLPIDVRRDCALVVAEIDRMGEKLKQLLDFAKPSVNGQTVAAVALARRTAALFARDAERRNLRFEFDGPTEEISVLASEDALGEALSNLIVNAIEAQPAGGRVRVALTSDTERMELRVEDDGPGISQELRAKIFQPYFTTKATGTGLGLSIVARRASEMGGTISCESPMRDGKGTRFILTLPLDRRQGAKSGI